MTKRKKVEPVKEVSSSDTWGILNAGVPGADLRGIGPDRIVNTFKNIAAALEDLTDKH